MPLNDISYTLSVIGAIILVSNMEMVNMYIARLWETNKNKTLNNLLAEALWNGSYAYTFVKYRCGKLYSTFPLVRSFVDSIREPKKSTNLAAEYPWASITQLFEANDGKLRVMETKFDINDFEWQNRSMSENLLNFNNMCKDLLQNNGNVVECLLLFAENANHIHSRVINRKNMDTVVDASIQNKSVDIKFLMIDYLHPTIEDSKEIVLDKPYFLEGNQILSGAFVGRLLTKEGYTGAFDKTYRIAIIDQYVNTVEWTYMDFIELTGDRQYVLRLNEPIHPAASVEQNKVVDDEDETKSWDKVDKE